MRVSFILFFLLFTLLSNGQNQRFDFVIIDYNTRGIVTKESVKQIDSISSGIDLYFLQEIFSEPLYLPDKFIDYGYKNDTITTNYSTDGTSNKSTGWTTTCIYDSLSRVISFNYSGCYICSDQAYNYEVIYNSLNKPLRLINTINAKDEFEIIYNTNGVIVQLNKYKLKKLVKTIKTK